MPFWQWIALNSLFIDTDDASEIPSEEQHTSSDDTTSSALTPEAREAEASETSRPLRFDTPVMDETINLINNWWRFN